MNKEIEQNLIGTWHIYEMEQWDEDYFNMEVQAFFELKENGMGDFQFGLVSASLDGKMCGERFEFNFEGFDECDETSGSGWITLKDKNTIEGEFRFFQGDDSTFLAKRAE